MGVSHWQSGPVLGRSESGPRWNHPTSTCLVRIISRVVLHPRDTWSQDTVALLSATDVSETHLHIADAHAHKRMHKRMHTMPWLVRAGRISILTGLVRRRTQSTGRLVLQTDGQTDRLVLQIWRTVMPSTPPLTWSISRMCEPVWWAHLQLAGGKVNPRDDPEFPWKRLITDPQGILAPPPGVPDWMERWIGCFLSCWLCVCALTIPVYGLHLFVGCNFNYI